MLMFSAPKSIVSQATIAIAPWHLAIGNPLVFKKSPVGASTQLITDHSNSHVSVLYRLSSSHPDYTTTQPERDIKPASLKQLGHS